MIDSHCHLADEVFVPDLDVVIARARDAGLTTALCILEAGDETEQARARSLAARWPALRFACGVHPNRAEAYAGRIDEAVRDTRQGVERMGAAAIGEIGLDYHYEFARRDVQRDVFAASVALAVTLDLPVVIHAREAMDDTVSVLREAGGRDVRGVMHCFSGSADEMRRSLDLGFFVSFAGIVTFPKAANVRDVARLVPLDRVLVETDAPFLAPVPYRGKRNEPAYVVETARHMAALHGLSVEAMSEQITHNFGRLVDHS